jgi:archaeal cell division control protein 6
MKIDPIVRETGPLAESYLPETLHGREVIQKVMLALLLPNLRGRRLPHLWLHGPPGSGKSTLTRKALGHLEEQRVRTAYVNCWGSQTFYSVLEAIFQELRALVEEKRDAAFKLERLCRLAREQPLVIVLDEVDQMFLQERNAALYNLSQLDHSGVICLSASRKAYLSLDPRVQSRLQPHFIEFPQYSPEQLASILQERAEKSLLPEAWCRADLERIAKASGGDARIAIQTLRTAAYLAEKGRVPQIRPGDIQEALRKTGGLKRRYALNNLSDDHRLLYRIVEESGTIKAGDLWKRYGSQAKEHSLGPMARRTFQHHKRRLLELRLLEEKQGRGRGNVRFLRVVE